MFVKGMFLAPIHFAVPVKGFSDEEVGRKVLSGEMLNDEEKAVIIRSIAKKLGLPEPAFLNESIENNESYIIFCFQEEVCGIDEVRQI